MNFLQLVNQKSSAEEKRILEQDISKLKLKKLDLEDQIRDIDNTIRSYEEKINSLGTNTVSLSSVLNDNSLWSEYGILAVFDSQNGKQVAYVDGADTKIYTVPFEVSNIKTENTEPIITNVSSSNNNNEVKNTVITMPEEVKENEELNEELNNEVNAEETTIQQNIEENNESSTSMESVNNTSMILTIDEYYGSNNEEDNNDEGIKEELSHNNEDEEDINKEITPSDIDNLIVSIEDYLKYDMELDDDNNYIDDIDYSLIEEEIFNDFDDRIANFNNSLSNLAAKSVIKDIKVVSFYQSKTIRVYVSPLVDKSRPGVSVPVCVAINDGKEWQIYCSYENEGNIQNIKTNIKLAVKNKYGETSNADLLVCGRFLETGFDAIVSISSDDFRCKELSTKYPTSSDELSNSNTLVSFDYGCNKDSNAINKIVALKLDEKLFCIITKEKDIRTKIISEEQSMETIFKRGEKTFSIHLHNNNLTAEYREMQTVYVQKEEFR